MLGAPNPRVPVEAYRITEVSCCRGRVPSLTGRQVLSSLIAAAVRDRRRHITYAIDLAQNSGRQCAENLDELLAELASMVITAEARDGDRTVARGALLASVACRHRATDLTVEFCLTPLASTTFSADNPHCADNSALALFFTSKYAPGLLRLVQEKSDRGVEGCYLGLIDLRRRLAVDEDKYLNWSDFRRFVLDPAIHDINMVAHLDISATEVRQARKVIGVDLGFSAKPWLARVQQMALRGLA